ncbi:MAG: ribosome biogenesis GTPase Der [Treponema sp.]|jgi:GTP-binding protein|nr:ribosome biogenesis GTPase Der [Treponema sp.]
MEFNPALKYRNLPSVALVGRPNVGKSTLFNRLLHARRAITDPVPGVTRDPLAATAFLAGKPVRLLDTGGFKLDRRKTVANGVESADDEIDDLVLERTKETVKQADLIVLILEAGELTPEDEEFIGFLRPFRERLLVAVNKTEGGRRESEAWNLLSYGFEDVYMISAEHGDNVAELEMAITGRLDFSPVVFDGEGTRPIRIALLGKPNTGKSTLSNRLTESSASIVSEKPGTTRDVVEGNFEYRGKSFHILDTAGIRRKARVTENVEYYSVNRAIKSIDEADIVFLLIDAEEGLSDQDKKIAALAHDQGRGIVFVLNKWDLMPDVKNTFAAVSDRLRFLFGQMEFAPIVALSAETGFGVEELLNTANRMYAQLTMRIETSRLNFALEKWLEEYPPPTGPNTRFKIKYAVQVSENPVKFTLFVSRLHAVTDPYISYLRNRIRKDLGFSLVPILIELRSSQKPGRDRTASQGGKGRRRKDGPAGHKR